jgi:transcription antitermination factor NusG
MTEQWYVLRSKPNKEITLWRELTARGFECYFPHLQVKPVNPRSRKTRAYFPGYLFLQTDMEQMGISMFQWMPFSSGFIAFDGVPATVPDSLIQAVRRHVDQINESGAKRLARIRTGDIVKIQGGPFDGYEAIFDVQVPGSERVRVLLKLLQDRHMSLELPEAQIQIPPQSKQKP